MRCCFRLFICTALFFIVTVAFGATKRQIPKDFREISGDRFIVDLRYNTADNFLHKNVYEKFAVNRCWLHPDAANRLLTMAPKLKKKHLKLVLWDCYRPLAVQKEMWKLVPDQRYVADPAKGSNHNRGLAVDVTLADEKGQLLAMPTGFDDFSERAAPDYKCEKNEKKLCRDRALLIGLMKDAGFRKIKTEWWHFSPAGMDYEKYPVW